MRLLRKTEIPDSATRGPGPLARAVAACLLCLPALFAGGCSDDAPPGQDADAVQGKTPVVRPEDVFVCGPGGASVLAPDYRREMTSDLEAEAREHPPGAGTVPSVDPAAAPPREPGNNDAAGFPEACPVGRH
jgi:hypothetical protein